LVYGADWVALEKGYITVLVSQSKRFNFVEKTSAASVNFGGIFEKRPIWLFFASTTSSKK